MDGQKNVFRADEYTRKSVVKLRQIEENEKLQQAIRNGSQEIFESIFENTEVFRLTWGDHIKRYIYDSIAPEGVNIEDITDKEFEDFIKHAFRENGMRNRGSMNPKTGTKLGNYLEFWMKSPVTGISRRTCFLFCFGLNMDEEQASYMLTGVLRKADFNVRDYREAIYYYCLRYNLQYAGVVHWLDVYDKLPETSAVKDEKDWTGTITLQKKLSEIGLKKDDEKFLGYLAELKTFESNRKKSLNCARVERQILSELEDSISEEKSDTFFRKNQAVDLELIEEFLLMKDLGEVEISPAMIQLMEERIITFPYFSAVSLKKKVVDRTTSVKREDVLMSAFLLCTCGLDMEANEDTEGCYAERKADFVYEANRRLEECGFGALYLLNPFELFLVSCLLQKRPLDYFLAAWRLYRFAETEEE